MRQSPGAGRGSGSSPDDAEPLPSFSCNVQRFPRRPRRYVAVWRWDDGTYSAVMIGLGGERVTNSKAYPTRAEAEACAQGAADQSGLPFIACGLEAAPPGDGGGLAA